MKKYFLLAFLVFSFACVQKHTIKPVGKLTPVLENNEQIKGPQILAKSDFTPYIPKKFNVWYKTQEFYIGIPITKLRAILGNNGKNYFTEVLKTNFACDIYFDDFKNRLAVEYSNGIVSRWVVNRNGCGSFLRLNDIF